MDVALRVRADASSIWRGRVPALAGLDQPALRLAPARDRRWEDSVSLVMGVPRTSRRPAVVVMQASQNGMLL